MKINDYLLKCNSIYHTTLDPKGPGLLRIHLIPPKKLKLGIPWVVIVNGYYILPIQTSWAILLKIFIDSVNETELNPVENVDIIIDRTVKEAKKIFNKTEEKYLKDDLKDILKTFETIKEGKEPLKEIGYISIAEYAKYMSGPHRMDLMLSAMTKNGEWHCNQKCLHCYASNEPMSSVEEIDTNSWKKIIDLLKEARIPMLTFTGGEPTLRDDLIELIDYSKWFVTRLNTNGIKLTKDYCRKLYKASLDSVQVTFYSKNEAIHNLLVGSNHYNETLEGIKNALSENLDVSVNTPLCNLNKDYLETVKFLNSLGVKYFTCSGLIPSGNAKEDDSKTTILSKEEITQIVKDVYEYTKDHECEISFTSPGWIDSKDLSKMKIMDPSCGACMSNMAIAPNGEVIPCQSWLFEDGLGNILTESFKTIWNSKKCKEIRKNSMKNEHRCPLKEKSC